MGKHVVGESNKEQDLFRSSCASDHPGIRATGRLLLGSALLALCWTAQAGTPQAGAPQADAPQAGTPQAGTPQAGTPQAGAPQADAPQAGTPQAGTPQAAEPQSQPGTQEIDPALLKELEAATAPPKSAETSPAAPPAGQGDVLSQVRAASNGLSNIFNPAMSVNGLFLGTLTNAPGSGEGGSGLRIQEVEMQFVTNVDPYFSANLVLSMDGGKGLEVEEGHLTLTPQPANLALRFGKLKVPFGRENWQHTHALPFVDRSLVGNAIFGEEGLGEVGLEASYLIPVPFYSLLSASVLDGSNELMFNSPNGRDLAFFGGLKNLFDLSDDATLELGLNYVAGNNADELLSQVAGVHLMYKWKPARASTTRSAVAVVEALYSHRSAVEGSESVVPVDLSGAYAYLQWQLARRWYIAGRFDYLGAPAGSTGQESAGDALKQLAASWSDVANATRKETVVLTLAPTEFSAVRLQGSATQLPGGADPIYEALLQVNFTLGAHPAHSY